MANKITVNLKAEHLDYLGKACGHGLTELSPLNGQGAELSESEIDELKKMRVIDGAGSITDSFKPALESLASANAFARTRLTRGRGLLEYVVFFSAAGLPCSLLTESDGLLLNYPADSRDFMPLLEELLGISSMSNLDFEAEWEHNQAIVMAAAMDITRRALLKALIDGSDMVNAEFSPEDIYQWLTRPADDAQWLSSVLKGIVPPIDLELSEIINSLDKLVQNGFVVKQESGFVLSEPTATLASRFMVVDKLMSMRAGVDNNGQIIQVGFICVLSGVNDLLMLEADENRIFMETASARQILDFARHLLSEPIQPTNEIKEAAASNVSPTPNAPVTLPCSACGEAMAATVKFCGKCGNPVKPAPKFCGKCGAEIEEGTRFCGECGSPI
ncbi:MAG: zinc ribbon domain-containing protein [Syntrophomonadaceae bacterium]|mgnify:CR=1 FL=1|jgi:hypothetical protein